MRLPQDRILHIDTELKDGKVNIVVEWQGELVRCKDCEHWASAEDYDCEIHSGAFGADDFCSYGECKGGDDE